LRGGVKHHISPTKKVGRFASNLFCWRIAKLIGIILKTIIIF
jgi:hypothetical protein